MEWKGLNQMCCYIFTMTCKNEMKDIISKLVDNCVCEDKKSIQCIIGNELANYVPPQHGKGLLDKLWQISSAIKDKKVLDMEYYKMGTDGMLRDEVSRRVLYPQGILFSENYFYLIAFIEGKSYEYPAIYRLDRIKDIVVTDRKYKVDYVEVLSPDKFREDMMKTIEEMRGLYK